MKDGKLTKYREAVGNSKAGDDLGNISKDLTFKGYEIGNTKWKRVPSKFKPDNKHADLLKHNGIFVVTDLTPQEALARKKLWVRS